MTQKDIEPGKWYIARIDGEQVLVIVTACRNVGDAFRGRNSYYKRIEYAVTDTKNRQHYLKAKDFLRMV